MTSKLVTKPLIHSDGRFYHIGTKALATRSYLVVFNGRKNGKIISKTAVMADFNGRKNRVLFVFLVDIIGYIWGIFLNFWPFYRKFVK